MKIHNFFLSLFTHKPLVKEEPFNVSSFSLVYLN